MRLHHRAAPVARLAAVSLCLSIVLSACGGGGGGGGGGSSDGGTGGGGGGGGTAGLPTTTTSSQSGYAKPTASGWDVVPLLTVGDTPEGASYEMVGKPDGLAAVAGRFDDSGTLVDTGRYFTVFMNHELPANRGAMRSHGTKGAFVSQWTIELDTLKTVAGRDLTQRVLRFAGGAWSDVTGTFGFERLCSSDLPARSALFDSGSSTGYDGRLYLTGEEVVEGLAFGYVVGGPDHGDTYTLPYLGKYSHENVLANPASGSTTLVVSPDDDGPGQVYVYVGKKQASGNPVERAGLHGGKLYGIRVTDGGSNYAGGPVTRENKGPINGRFELVDVSDAALGSGANLQTVSVNRGVTEFARPEDGAWNAGDPRAFFLAVTGQNLDGTTQTPRLYRLVFDSITQPTGGTIETIVDGGNVVATDGSPGKGFDNVTVDGGGRVLVMEDGGDSDHVSKVWRFSANGSQVTQALEADRARFAPGGASFLTSVGEHSDVIEVTDQVRGANWFQSGRRYYLGTLQAHYPLAEALFEGGQLYLFASPD